ncbi:hypothetical protein M569_17727, partial [Genlisea aurea]
FNPFLLICVSPCGCGLLGKIPSICLQQLHGISLTLPFFLPAFSSVFPAYLSSALSTGQGSFFIH